MNNKMLYLYGCTALVCLLFACSYTFIENCYSDENFDQKTSIEKQLYLKYSSDPLSFNLFDSYFSKLENTIMYLCWLLGVWNLMDFLLLIGMKDIPSSKPEDCLTWQIINTATYKCIVRKIKNLKR